MIKTQQLISNQVLLKIVFFRYSDLKLSLHRTLDKGEVSGGRLHSSRTGIIWGGPNELKRIAAQETHLIWHSFEYLTFYKEIQKCNQPYSLWCSKKYRLSSMCCLCEHEKLRQLGKISSSSCKDCPTLVEQTYCKNSQSFYIGCYNIELDLTCLAIDAQVFNTWEMFSSMHAYCSHILPSPVSLSRIAAEPRQAEMPWTPQVPLQNHRSHFPLEAESTEDSRNHLKIFCIGIILKTLTYLHTMLEITQNFRNYSVSPVAPHSQVVLAAFLSDHSLNLDTWT